MTERTADAEESELPGAASISRRNPYLVALAIVGSLAWVLAFMLWNVLVQVTDYTTYDIETASALATWINSLLLGGFAAIVGAVAVAGVRRELRNLTGG